MSGRTRIELRAFAAFNAKALTALSRIFADAVGQWYRRWAERDGIASADAARAGAVTFVQRFGSSLNLNVHFHMCFLDEIYVRDERGCLAFHCAPSPDRDDLDNILRMVHRRALQWIARHGHLERPLWRSARMKLRDHPRSKRAPLSRRSEGPCVRLCRRRTRLRSREKPAGAMRTLPLGKEPPSSMRASISTRPSASPLRTTGGVSDYADMGGVRRFRSKGNFVRAPDQDDKCADRPVTANQKKRSRAYVAKAYGYSGSCADYNDDDQFTDGETFCCSYP